MYIYQITKWPKFEWDDLLLSAKQGDIRQNMGMIFGQLKTAGFKQREEALLKTLTLDVTKSSAIEGEILDKEQVRSSIARRLRLKVAGMVPTNRRVDGVVEMMLDATQHFNKSLTINRLYSWHSSLFQSESNNTYKIIVGSWRDDETGPMQVVSGPLGMEQIHFQAPEAKVVPSEMKIFLTWFNKELLLDSVIKAAIANLWFVTIHPFDDGNGRITRAITDMQLAKADKSALRFYSMSAQIEKERKVYYEILEKTQKGTLDITEWLLWFLDCLGRSLDNTVNVLEKITTKSHFRDIHSSIPLNSRQKTMTDMLLDDFFGKLNVSKWAKITKSSTDTALRDIRDLIYKGIFEQNEGGGRNTNYKLKLP